MLLFTWHSRNEAFECSSHELSFAAWNTATNDCIANFIRLSDLHRLIACNPTSFFSFSNSFSRLFTLRRSCFTIIMFLTCVLFWMLDLVDFKLVFVDVGVRISIFWSSLSYCKKSQFLNNSSFKKPAILHFILNFCILNFASGTNEVIWSKSSLIHETP